ARHVSVRGQETRAVERRMGPLQPGRHRARRRGVPSARQGRLPAGEDELIVIASEAKRSRARQRLDCFVASLLAMTNNKKRAPGTTGRVCVCRVGYDVRYDPSNLKDTLSLAR